MLALEGSQEHTTLFPRENIYISATLNGSMKEQVVIVIGRGLSKFKDEVVRDDYICVCACITKAE